MQKRRNVETSKRRNAGMSKQQQPKAEALGLVKGFIAGVRASVVCVSMAHGGGAWRQMRLVGCQGLIRR